MVKGIVLQPGNFQVNSDTFYYIESNSIMLCVEQFQEFLSRHLSKQNSSGSLSDHDFISTVLSLICSTLSIVSLAITFIIYSILPRLRLTIPGKNNMSLVFFMLLAQVLYLISGFGSLKTDSTECFVLGMALHFFWLISLFWMNICTFQAFRVFSDVKLLSHLSGNKRFVGYHIFALVISSVFVALNITLSTLLSGLSGYGGNNCYISSQEMINFTFVLPTGFVILTNFVMFLYVIITIKTTHSVKRHIQNERSDLNVFLKLSTITGVTWIFGLLYTFTNVRVFSYLFIVLNACQGVFIMFAFVTNSRVFNLMKTFSTSRNSTKSQNKTEKTEALRNVKNDTI
ncbi:adhesion G-protein coupled receptor D1-like [Ruditapes philippinarum]|uniref:adhesion G-protein coupled receptor D1-like n=1 Tax=Ruditapes philippinarum TaxID=129788 RepID=UPI00295B42D3|nr:adhesion G-protein coupled receptor D1-like [Ruditapes philippinarum]